jgi:FAD/FMN-containing dehydrogenase/Fe-S oxidoreductase
MKLNELFLLSLQNSGFEGDIATQKSVTVTYSTDNSIYEIEPEGVIFPRSENDIELIFKLLRQKKFHQIKITARGGGTSTNGQSINNGFIVDYSRYMNRILKIDAESMTAEVEPGVILDLLNSELEKFNLYFPPNISPSNRATIGGMVNTDACGKGSCTLGRTSDNISDLKLHVLGEENVISSKLGSQNLNKKLSEILARARNLYSSKHLARTTTGYNIEKSFAEENLDLNYLISGSEGTLACVSKITVKLKKLPAKKRVALLSYKNFDAALKDARNLIALHPTAIETIDENVINLARHDIIWQDVGHLIGDSADTSVNILEFAYDSEEEFERHEQALKQRLTQENFLFENHFIINHKSEIANIWNLRKQGVGLLGAMKGKRRPLPFVEDTIVPPAELANYISGFRQILKKHGVTYGMFGHVDAGCLHVRPALNMRQESDRVLIRKISDEVCELLLKHRGIIWGEHGKGFRSEFSEKFLGAEVVKIFQEIKKTFDPYDQLNCGKIASATQSIQAIDSVTTRGEFDENISTTIHDEFENILSCNGNALCFNLDKTLAMCPSYKATGDRRFSPKGRAMLFKEWVRENSDLPSIKKNISAGFFKNFGTKFYNLFHKNFDSEIYQSFAKCLGCKACNTQCPIKVSIPDAKAYFLSFYFTKNFRKCQDYLIGNIEKLLLIFGQFPRTFNFVTQQRVTKFLARKIFGVTDILSISSVTLKASKRSDEILHSAQNNSKIYILRDAYSNYFHGADLQNAFELLTKLGFKVEFTKVFENGKALHAKGFLNQFRKVVAKNISYLSSLKGTLISVDPSVALSYRDEYPRFCDQKIDVLYLAEFLQKVDVKKPAISDKKYHLILHCSEQTNFGKIAEIWSEIFVKFGIKLNIIKTGCCGMSGSFGMEVQNFSDSKKIFQSNWQELLAKLAQDPNNKIMVSGSSCKSQVERFSKTKTQNPVIFLNNSISQDGF